MMFFCFFVDDSVDKTLVAERSLIKGPLWFYSGHNMALTCHNNMTFTCKNMHKTIHVYIIGLIY